MQEFNTKPIQQCCDNIVVGHGKKLACKCICSNKECQLLRCGRQTKQQLDMLVIMLPNVKNEQLSFVILDFKPCKRYIEGSL